MKLAVCLLAAVLLTAVTAVDISRPEYESFSDSKEAFFDMRTNQDNLHFDTTYDENELTGADWITEDVYINFTYFAPNDGDINVGPCALSGNQQNVRISGNMQSPDVYMDVTYWPGTEWEQVTTIKVADAVNYQFETNSRSTLDTSAPLPDIFFDLDYDHSEYFGTCADLSRSVEFGSHDMEEELLPALEEDESVDDNAGLNRVRGPGNSRCRGHSNQGACHKGGHSGHNGNFKVGCSKNGPTKFTGNSKHHNQHGNHHNNKHCKRNSHGRCNANGNRDVVEDVVESTFEITIQDRDVDTNVAKNAPHPKRNNPPFTVEFWSPYDLEEDDELSARDNASHNGKKHRRHGNKKHHRCHRPPGLKPGNKHPQG